VAKRLRSNKGKVVPSENKTPKKTTTDVTETPKAGQNSLVLDLRKVGVK